MLKKRQILRGFCIGLYGALFSLIVVFVRGYSFGLGDQVIHLPLLYKLIDSSLFNTDPIFPVVLSNYTPFYSALASFLKSTHFDIYHVFFVLYYLCNTFFLFGVFLVSYHLTKNKKAAFLSTLFFIFPLPVGGSAITTVETSFTPRMLGGVFIWYILFFFLKKQYSLFFLLGGFLFLIHPIFAILTGILFIPAIVFFEKTNSFLILLKGICTSVLVMIWFLPNFLNSIQSLNSSFFVSTDWLEVLQLRNTYAFPHLWNPVSTLYGGILLLPLVVYFGWKKIKKEDFTYNEKVVLFLFLNSCVILLFQILFTFFIPISLIISLQLGRIWLFTLFFSLLYGSRFLFYMIMRYKYIYTHLELIICLILFISLFFRNGQMFQTQNADWIDIQKWANSHTGTTCTFFVSFYSQGFRVFSSRSTTGDYKDGTLSFYSQKFSHQWLKKYKLFTQISTPLSKTEIQRISSLYPFSFIVMPNSDPVEAEIIYRNNLYSLYRMSTLEKECQLHI